MRLLSVIILLTLSSCGVLKNHYLQKYCKTKDSIIETIVKKDTTIYITQTVETPIYLDNPCKWLCDSLGNLKKFDTTVKKNGVKMNINTNTGKLKFTCKADSLEHVIKGLITEKSKYQLRTIEKKVNELTKWQSFLIVSAYIFFGILLIYLVIKAIRLYLHV